MKTGRHLLRLLTLALFFIGLFVILIWRIVDLTVLDRKFLQGQGNARSLRIQDIPAYRGMITDRNGVPLAVSTPVASIWVNPKEFSPDSANLKRIQKYLNIDLAKLNKALKQARSKEFFYLKRQVTPSLAKKIADLKIPGLYLQREFKRYYPEAQSSAQLVGFTNIDDQGIEGLELVYQDWLMGIMGKKRVLKDRLGRVIEELDVIKEPRSGHDLALSIDRRLQYLAYRELNKTVKEFSAKSGSVVVLDAQSGEVLTIVNAPSFNPNSRGQYDRKSYRNRAITDIFEPGSVIKPFSVASALESGLFKPDTEIDTNPSWMMVHGHAVRDIHNYGVLDVTGVLQHSSNVGITKMLLKSPPDQFISLLERCGFGQRTETAFPGESNGMLVKVADANPFVYATLGFGYGLSVSALQLAKAYMVFANEGKLKQITLLHHDRLAEPVAVMKQKTAQQVLLMMEAVIGKEGTGRSAQVPGYRVAGKTGTSRIAGKKGYEADRHIASFVGIAPVSNPRFVVVVIIHEPQNKYYAAQVAAPLFAKVMGGALRMFDIQPDQSYS